MKTTGRFVAPPQLKWALLAIVAMQVLILLVTNSYVPFNLLGSHGLPPLLDVKNIISAIDCSGSYDVLNTNPCDIYQRPMNYPRVWLLFPFSMATIQYLFIVLYLLYCGLLYRLFLCKPAKFTIWHGILVFYFIFSPATQLLFIRMNNDWIIFLLIFLFVFLRTKKQEVPAAFVLMAAIVLKLYPIILVLTWFDKFNRKNLSLAVITALSGLAYFWFIRHDIQSIGKVVPASASMSFGFKVMGMIVFRFVKKLMAEPTSIKFWLVFVGLFLYGRYYLYSLVKTIIIPAANEVLYDFQQPRITPLYKKLFVAGSLVFLFTYFMGTNFDYRLIYLVFVFPMLLATGRPAFSVSCMMVLLLCCFLSEYGLDYVNDFLFVFPAVIFLFYTMFRLCRDTVRNITASFKGNTPLPLSTE